MSRVIAVLFGVVASNFGCARPIDSSSEAVQPAIGPRDALHFKKVFPPVISDETPEQEYVFAVENRSDQTVRFANVRRSCSCSDVRLDAMTLGPGETTSLRALVRLSGRFGPQRLSCMIDEDNGRVWSYELETAVYTRARFPEGAAVHFGMVDPGAEVERVVEFHSYGRTEAELPSEIAIVARDPRVSLEVRPALTEQTDDGIFLRKTPIRVSLKAPVTAGTGQTALAVKYTHQGTSDGITAGVDWTVRTLVAARPGQIYFSARERDSGKRIEKRVVLKRADGQPLAVRSVQSPHPGLTCKSEPMTGGRCLLTVEYDAGLAEEFLTGTAVIETDHPLQTIVRVPIGVAPRDSRDGDD